MLKSILSWFTGVPQLPPVDWKAKYEEASAAAEKMKAERDGIVAEKADAVEAGRQLMADLERLRERSRQDLAKAKKFGAEKLAKDLINVADNFDRALSTITDNVRNDPEASGIVQGLEMIRDELLAIFETHGIQNIEAAPGSKFNASFHRAVARVSANETCPAGTVAEVAVKGYTLHGERVLRTAQVVVATAPETPAASDASEEAVSAPAPAPAPGGPV